MTYYTTISGHNLITYIQQQYLLRADKRVVDIPTGKYPRQYNQSKHRLGDIVHAFIVVFITTIRRCFFYERHTFNQMY